MSGVNITKCHQSHNDSDISKYTVLEFIPSTDQKTYAALRIDEGTDLAIVKALAQHRQDLGQKVLVDVEYACGCCVMEKAPANHIDVI